MSANKFLKLHNGLRNVATNAKGFVIIGIINTYEIFITVEACAHAMNY